MEEETGNEEWRPVPGFEGYYEVSDQGRVRSLDRADPRGRRLNGQLLSSRRVGSDQAYVAVNLSRDGVAQQRYIHRLVLEAFAGPCPDGMSCRRADADKSNNRLSNLRWDRPWSNPGASNGGAVLSPDQVTVIRAELAAGVTGRELAARYGVAATTISQIKTGKAWRNC